jgi:hypothetical protein
MARYSKIDGNYVLAVTDGGEIKLDVGPNSGGGIVRITGDLVVEGDTTTVSTAELQIEDRIITLNKTASAISAVPGRVAGLEVYRGSSDEVYFVFDEDVENGPGNSLGYGAWAARKIVPSTSGSTLLGIQTHSIDTKGASLFLINQGSGGIVTVEGCVDYQESIFPYVTPGSTNINVDAAITKPDGLINAQGVADYTASFFQGKFQDKISEGTTTKTSVEVFDLEVAGALDVSDVGYRAASAIEFEIDGGIVSKFFATKVQLQHIEIDDTTISTTSAADLVIKAPGPNSVRIDDVLHLTPGPFDNDANLGVDADTTKPDFPTTGVKMYADTESAGGTGLHFVNSNNKADEVISRNRAILYSMIF